MKKFLILTLVVAALCLALASCEKETPTTTQSAHQHIPGAWVTVKQPSCQDGEQSQFCATCGELLQTLPIAATGVHVEMIDKAVEPTCTSTGLTEGKHCMTCGKTFVAQVEVPKIAHSYDDKNDETCNACDFVRDVTCKHIDVTVMESKDATCTEAGITEGIVCNGCEEILQVQEVIDALGHHEIVDYGYDATCTEAGLTDGKHCNRCEEILVAQSYIKALGHNESEWIIEKEPTETKDGYKYKTCSICKEKTQEEIIPYIGDLGLDYTVNSDGETCTVTGIGTFEGTVLNIPDYIRQYKVVGIGENAFADCTKLREIKIPEMVETIGTRAFYGCTGLTEITIPSSVTSIGNQIFYKADNLNTVYYNSTYGSQSNNFLSVASIKKVVFGGKYVPSNAFYHCANIETVEFVSNITSIGNSAFYGCSSLTSITIPESVTSIDSYAFRGCSSLTSIVIPDSVTSIDSYAFEGCSSLTSIAIPDSVTNISTSGLFCYCSSLTSINIPNSVTSIGAHAFNGCSSLTSIEIPDSVTSIGSSAFHNCSSLTSIVIPDSVTSIGDSAFSGCSKLEDVYYAGTLKNWLGIGFGNSYSNPMCCGSNLYFDGKLVTDITLPDGVTSIDNWKFYGCTSLTSVEIPDSVTSIGEEAFYGCSSLTSIVIPNSVTSIGSEAFYNCSKLTIYCEAEEQPSGWASDWNRLKYDYKVPVIWSYDSDPFSKGLQYTLDPDGQSYSITGIGTCKHSNITIPETYEGLPVTSIGDSAFYGCSSLKEIEISNSITSIGNNAFYGCSSLKEIEIPNSVTSIGDGAFEGCSLLTSIVIPDSVTSIGSYAFDGCSSLTSIEIPNSVTSIGNNAFYGCSSLKEIEISNSITSIGNNAFYGCSSLKEIEIPNSVTSIGDGAFSGCSLLTNIVIPNSVTSIGDGAFEGCSLLTSINISNSVTSIGNNAFYGCSSLIIYCEAEEQPSGWASDWNKLDSESEIHVVWNEEYGVYGSISFDNIFNRTSFSATQQIWNAPGITVINNRGMLSADIADYHNPVRFYSYSQVIVMANDMVQIEFVCNTEEYASALVASLPEGTVYFVSGKVVTITFEKAVDSFEIASMNGQVRVDSITVY